MSDVVRQLENHKELLTLLVAVVGGAFALWRWREDQRWRRVQQAQTLVKEFLQKETTKKAFEILDVEGEVVEFGSATIEITDDFLIGAISTFDQEKNNSEMELVVRGILDEFFDDLSIFQSHVEAGLIELKDIKPYLEYWIRELTGRGRLCGKSFAEQTLKYLRFFGYNRVETMAANMGLPVSSSCELAPRGRTAAAAARRRPSPSDWVN